jgi:toxin ParE1/3/4
MVKIIWTMRAADDLEEIAEYIASDNPDAAAKVVKEVLESIERLADFPYLGRVVPELRTQRYRELIVPPCRIIYMPTGETVVIQRIIRGEQRIHRGIVLPGS